MIELPFGSLDVIKSTIENFAIIATLTLLYYFIPDSLRSRSKLLHSLSVGIVFGFAALITIPALWQAMGAPAAPFFGVDPVSLAGSAAGGPLQTMEGRLLGVNIILVPLSGFIAGPISSVVVAGGLLLGSLAMGEPLHFLDILTLLLGILLGALFYWFRTWDRFLKSFSIQILLLGAGFALVNMGVVAFNLLTSASSGPGSPGPETFPLNPTSFVICCAGIIILGSIIGFIDRKKQTERELRDYQDHLEDLVKERTAELRQANSLQKATFESTADGVVVTDRNNMIREYNRKASRILNLPDEPPYDPEENWEYADHIVASLSDPETFVRRFEELAESAEQIVTTDMKFTSGRIYELYVHPRYIGEQIVGRVWNLHDITDQRLAEEALQAANSKLILLANITRHDILNQLTALRGYLELIGEKPHDAAVPGYLDTMDKTLEAIRLQIEFTRDYQELGLRKPVWQDICLVFQRASEPFAGQDLVFTCDTGSFECYADSLIERAFYNMIDNSIRHGEHVSAIRLSCEKTDPDLLLIYEDNGIGVPPEEKEKIFLKGFGKHTGLGMFLIKEILSITGMALRETGIPGKGVRFEIRIPAGKFRFT